MKIALAQTNPLIGDVLGNTRKIIDFVNQARDAGADLVVFPEQSIIGYPAKDLLLRQGLIEQNVAALDQIAAATRAGGAQRAVAALVGFAEPNDKPRGRPIFNSAALIRDGRVMARVRKRLLPTYDIFDESRYFEPGDPQGALEFPTADAGSLRLGVTICEDMWAAQDTIFKRPLYSVDPVADVAGPGGLGMMLNISASPYGLHKHPARLRIIADHAVRHRMTLVYVNQVGGNDEVLFDGASCVVAQDGSLIAQARALEEDLLVVDLDNPRGARNEPIDSGIGGMHDALVMGLRDYVRKCGFAKVVLGLSGGVDSAVVACLATAALGPENVHGVAMPSRFSSTHSLEDARGVAANLGIQFRIIPIEPMHAAFEHALQPLFAGMPPDATEENIQARIRGVTLMALSNKFCAMLLTTANKSELSVGYTTLYGDMCGGLAVISDVPKTIVYQLALEINRRGAARRNAGPIPERTLTKPPSAELRPNQTDQDTLPPYEVLDAILDRYEQRLQSVEQIVAEGFDRRVVEETIRRVEMSEYKRQQAAPGLKVTSRAFGFGRRMPIAARHFR